MIEYLIIGAGGAGRTVLGGCAHLANKIGFLDDHATQREINHIPVLGPLAARANYRNAQFIIAFGDRYQRVRRELFDAMTVEGYRFFNVVAQEAYVDRDARIGSGVFIAAHCAVLPNAIIGNNCNLCVSSTVDHDAVLGNGVYLSPGVNLAGTVVIEDGAFIGANATVVPGVRIGAWARVGAGAVVLHDVTSGDVVAGVPAKGIHH